MVLEADDVITTESCRAPEVFLGMLTLSSAVDMWAIGTVGVSMLCGSTISGVQLRLNRTTMALSQGAK